MTSGRHRINHGGHRQLNAAIYRTVIVRMRFHEPTIAYVARRTAEAGFGIASQGDAATGQTQREEEQLQRFHRHLDHGSRFAAELLH